MTKKIACIFILLTLISCESREFVNECFPDVNVFSILNTRLPQNQKLSIDGTSSTYNIQNRNIFIIRNSSSNFIAFDLECPDRTCDKPLNISNLPSVTCECDNKKYNYLEGGRLIGEEGCGLLMYTVSLINNGNIQISN